MSFLASQQTPLPLSPPLFPTAKFFPSPFNPATIKMVQSAKRTTSATPNTTDSFFIGMPANAVALAGISISDQTSGRLTNYAEVSAQLLGSPSDVNPGNVCDFCFTRGTKSAWGSVPVDPSILQLQAGVTAVDASFQYVLNAYFLVSPSPIPLTTVPLQAEGGNDVIVTTANVSAANAAQTVDFTTIGNVDLLEILNASFYNSGAGTATGNAGFYDGTTRVDYDTTAAVATYAFNMGAKGSRTIYGNQAQGVNLRARFVIGAGGVGVTTTLNVTYRAGVTR